VRRPDLPGGEIYRTIKTIHILPAKAAPDREIAHYPVVPAGIIVHGKPPHLDHLTAKAGIGLGCDRVLANSDGLLCGKPVSCAISITITVTIKRPIAWIAPPILEDWTALVAIGLIAAPVLSDRPTVLRPGSAIITPEDIEGVALGAALGIGNLHHRSSAITRITSQSLAAAAIYASETKVRGIRRERTGAFKAAPLRCLAVCVAQGGSVTSDFDLSAAIHHDLNGAFAVIRTASANYVRSALQALLSKGRPRHGDKRSHHY
jgi:hypothetical protein